MLNEKGFSLFEILLSLMIISILLTSLMSFYPKSYSQIQTIYRQYRLQELIEQGIRGLIKDIKRAGFVANPNYVMTEPAIAIHLNQQCILIYYDTYSRGSWQNDDSYAYRYKQGNIEHLSGTRRCQGTGWGRIFDPNEVNITHFIVTEKLHGIDMELSAHLQQDATVQYHITRFIRTENQYRHN